MATKNDFLKPATTAGNILPLGTNAAKGALELPVVIFLITLFIPLSFQFGSLALSLSRILLVLMLVPALIRWISTKKNVVDFLVLIHVLWAALAILVVHGADRLEAIGIYTIEVLGAYFLARSYLGGLNDLLGIARILRVAMFFLIPICLTEAITNQNFFVELFGSFVPERVFSTPRLGFFRAQGPFEHSILLGVVCGMAIAPIFYCIGYGRRTVGKALTLFAPVLVLFLSLSSSAFAICALQISLIAWDILVRGVNKWIRLIWAVVIAYVFVELGSNRSAYQVLISYLSFNADSAYNRILIWKFSSDDLFENPIFGIGFNAWDYPVWHHSSSTDNFWLVVALRYGVPGFLLLVCAFSSALISAAKTKLHNDRSKAYRKAYVIMLISISFGILNVHLWSESFLMLIFMLGLVSSVSTFAESKINKGPSRSTQTRAATYLQ